MFKPGFIGRARTPAYKSNLGVRQSNNLSINFSTVFNSLSAAEQPVVGDTIIVQGTAIDSGGACTATTPSGWVSGIGTGFSAPVWAKVWTGTEGTVAFFTGGASNTMEVFFVILQGGSRTPAGYGLNVNTAGNPAAATLSASGRTGPALAYGYVRSVGATPSLSDMVFSPTPDFKVKPTAFTSLFDAYVFAGVVFASGALQAVSNDIGSLSGSVSNSDALVWIEF